MSNFGSNKATVLSLNNQKGGVGKTTMAAALAVIFAQQGLRVLAIDNDQQANLSNQFGFDGETVLRMPTISDVYQSGKVIAEVAVQTDYANLWLVPSSLKLGEVEMWLNTQPATDLRLRRALKDELSKWDIVIVDSGPQFGPAVLNSLVAADWLLVPVDAAVWSLDAVGSVLNVLKGNRGFYETTTQVVGVVLTMTERTRNASAVREAAQDRYPDHLLKTEIRKASVGKEAATMGQPVPVYAPKSDLASDYYALAAEIAPVLGLSELVSVGVAK